MAKRLKIMLITPPYHSGVVESAGTWLPLSLVYLAGSLRQRGHEAVIYDAMSHFVDHERIKKEIESVKPDVVGVTAITACVPDALKVCAGAKDVNSSIKTVLGNVHPTFMWHEILSDASNKVDYIVRGEGEETMGELADAIAEKDDVGRVKNIAFRADDGTPIETPPRDQIADLDSLPRAWDLLDWSLYSYRPVEKSVLAIVSSSRGCKQFCSFCSQQLFWNRSWRYRSPTAFADELAYLKKTYGVNVAMISDETPTTSRERWEAILDTLMERDIGVELLMETRVDDILRDEDILHKYRRAGVSHIYVGVESTDQSTLDSFKKDITVEQSKRAIELINGHDMVSETSFLLGMPDETPEHIRTTIELAKHYAPDLAFFLAVAPWPYADIYPELKPFVKIFDYSKYNLIEPVLEPKNMSLKQVSVAIMNASREFYMDKLNRLDHATPKKREFMIKVMRLLMDHSYLSTEMKSMGAEMPAWVKAKLDRLRQNSSD